MKMIKKIAVSISVVAFFCSYMAYAQINKSDAIQGTFKIKDKDVEVKIYKDGDLYFGKTTNTTSRLSEGSLLLKDLKYREGKWTGLLLIPSLGKELNCTVRQLNSSTIKLEVKWGVLAKSLVWNRIKD